MLVPVASRSLIGRKRISQTPDLFDYPLLSAKTRSDEWPNWFANQREKLPNEQRYIIYDSIALVIDAAIAGVGIALVDKLLIKDDIRRKLLRVLIDKPLKGLNAYYVVTQTVKTPDPKTILFRNWLISEFARDTE